ncbi:hypothetical protein BDZ88DRAFT_440085 [Geranomyces variabilis]|nr:hypothetical protein BDZ88DRAFT_440085 [Geranomyces variabilis]KAJ3137600.1 hypothetical protein HDU90_002004 [Geranomyces variabilis]
MRPLLAAGGLGLVIAAAIIAYEFIKANQQEWFESSHSSGGGGGNSGRGRQFEESPFARRARQQAENRQQQEKARKEHEEEEAKRRKRQETEERERGEIPQVEDLIDYQDDNSDTHLRRRRPHHPSSPASIPDATTPPAYVSPSNTHQPDTSVVADSVAVLTNDITVLEQTLLERRRALEEELADFGWTEEQVRALIHQRQQDQLQQQQQQHLQTQTHVHLGGVPADEAEIMMQDVDDEPSAGDGGASRRAPATDSRHGSESVASADAAAAAAAAALSLPGSLATTHLEHNLLPPLPPTLIPPPATASPASQFATFPSANSTAINPTAFASSSMDSFATVPDDDVLSLALTEEEEDDDDDDVHDARRGDRGLEDDMMLSLSLSNTPEDETLLTPLIPPRDEDDDDHDAEDEDKRSVFSLDSSWSAVSAGAAGGGGPPNGGELHC